MVEKLIVILILVLFFIPIFYHLFSILKEQKGENKAIPKRFVGFAKYGVLALIILVLFFGTINHTNYLDYEKPLTFDNYEQITFENFRGLEFFKKTLYGNKRFAYVVTTFDTKIEDSFVIVRSLFHPSRSFVYKKNTNSRELLIHEKYHIKITELFTRKAKKKITNLDNFGKDKIKRIINESKKEEREFQDKYDYDTYHSYVLSEQKRYEKEIDSLLDLLIEYKEPKIQINEKD